MLQRLKLASFALILVLVLAGVTLVPIQVNAQSPKEAACEGLSLTGGNCGNPAASENEVSKTIGTVIGIFSIIIGVAAVIMIIIGGLKYVTSAGDSNSTASAKNTILYAIIGLVVVVLAQVIVRFVLTRL